MDNELLSQAISLSLESDVEEKEKFKIQSFQDIQTKLHFLPSTLSTWYPDEYTLICMRPRIDKCKIQINTYLSVEFDLSIKAFHYGERLLTSHVTLCDIRQLELVLEDIYIPRSARIYSEDNSTNSDNASHILSAESHILQVIDNLYDSKTDDLPCPEVSRLQFVLCQLQNSLVPKNRRRYNVLTQILSLKTHLISPASYHYL